MSDPQTAKSRNTIGIIICGAIVVIAIGFAYSLLSQGSTTLPQSKDTFSKFDHFRFQPSFQFLDYQNNKDLGQFPASYMTMSFYRSVNDKYEKVLQETYKDKQGKLVSVITVPNSEDTIIYLAVDDSEQIQLSPIDFQKWNQILEYDSFDINHDGIPDHVFKLDLKDARDYYQLKDKVREYSDVQIMIPVKVAPIIGA